MPEYWIVDVVARRIEVYREPSDGTFLAKEVVERGESIAPLRFPDVMVAVSSVMK